MAPPLVHTSAGIRALYILRDELVARGCEATMVDYRVHKAVHGHIVVYPEVTHGNPLESDRVVRWTLNKPGHLGGDKEYPASEYVWTWSKDFYDAPLLTVDTVEHDIFYRDTTPKTQDCAYFGKGAHRGVARIPLTRHMPEINRNIPPWPPTRKDLGDLLRTTVTLYTYDDCTQIIDEAFLCGCKVVLLPENRQIIRYGTVIDHAPRIDAFVEATQAWASS